MAESIEQIEEIAEIERRLAELRAVLGRIERGCLEIGDRPLLLELVSELIEEAEESGQEWVTLELPDAEKALVREAARAVVVEDSAPKKSRR